MVTWASNEAPYHREVPSPFEPSLLEDPKWVNSFDKKKAVKHESFEETGVEESIYANWIKGELEKEAACLELPFSVVFLGVFAVFALGYLAQDVVMSVENSIETDIMENANFAFEGYFGNKNINDVNSFADFWSWARLGLLPLLYPDPPYAYSEGLADALQGYNVSALPTQWQYPGYDKPAPVQNDYLRYNRIIGGLRFRQEVSADDKAICTSFGQADTFRSWIGKPCTHFSQYELPPDLVAAESFSQAPARIEWFLPEAEGQGSLLQHIIDMEDGCFSAQAQNRTCLCRWCNGQAGPFSAGVAKRRSLRHAKCQGQNDSKHLGHSRPGVTSAKAQTKPSVGELVDGRLALLNPQVAACCGSRYFIWPSASAWTHQGPKQQASCCGCLLGAPLRQEAHGMPVSSTRLVAGGVSM
ncbi:unnamed protein product [Effrenium voratum]|nr:unnamed protein product [Effrenium voratum]